MKNSLYVHIVLDSSGSMFPNKSVTLKACNDYIAALDEGTIVTVDRFAYKPHRLIDAKPKDQAKIAPDDYPCSGGTALYDAVGHAIADIDAKAKDFDRIALVVQTDGQETSSTEFSLAAIRQVLQDKEQGEGWLIVYLGAGIGSALQFAAMGASQDTMSNYTMGSSAQTFAAVSRSTRAYSVSESRISGRAAATFTADERNKMK